MARNNKPGISKLLSAMRKMIREVNDQEICRRLEILINTEKEDLSTQLVRTLMESPEEANPSQVQEPYTQYVKHYLYMMKRESREQRERDREEKSGAGRAAAGSKTTTVKKSSAGTVAQAETGARTTKKSASKSGNKSGAKKTATRGGSSSPTDTRRKTKKSE